MNSRQPYRPQPPQIPADPLRGNPCDTHDPRICVQPLKGLGETRAAAVSYRALSPDGERQNCPVKALPNPHSISTTAPPFRHTPFRPRPRHTATVWRNLGQHPHRDGTFTFSAKERDPETGLSYFGSRYYSSDLSIWLSVDPMAHKYPSLSPYTYCANNPVKLVDPNGEEVWHPDGEGGLIGDQGDDFSTLQKYLSTIYGNQTAIPQDNWNSFETQINNYLTQNDTRDAEGIRLYSSDGVFDNLVGKYLMTMCQTDPTWGLGPEKSNNCFPTTFNRVDKATEFVYGVDLLGEIKWKNNYYKAWQGCGPTALENFGTGVVVAMNLGFQVNNTQSDLQQGAILGLVGESAWHSAFFIDYIYDGCKKIGFKYWDQNEPYIHNNLFENGTYKIRKGVNFK